MLQGFPATWQFCGRKTAAYRQVGNAFPPPVARAVGEGIRAAILGAATAPPAPRCCAPSDCPGAGSARCTTVGAWSGGAVPAATLALAS